MILVDTSVWVDHLRLAETQLATLLVRGTVAMHPMIIGELACGNLRNRTELLSLWRNLPPIVQATHDEALYFLEQNRLMGKGVGWVDIHLLAAVALRGDALLWSRDKRLAGLAVTLGLAFQEA
jgi:predicted nucleic acid-binding protein